MPVKNRFWLNQKNGLFPKSGTPSKQDHPEPVLICYQWVFHLSVEDDQLLAQHRIFDQQVGPAADQI